MPHFVIIGREPGSMVDWLGAADGAFDAAAAFAAVIGGEIDASTILTDSRVIEVTEDQVIAIDAWIKAGSRASEAPDILD